MKKNILHYFVSCALLLIVQPLLGWTTTHHFSSDDFHYQKSQLVVEKNIKQHPFNQLLVSWNSDMPSRGFFRFYLEVYDEQIRRWSSYKMYEWGKGVSRSFLQRDTHSKARYTYVRFEGAPGRKYKKFRIKVRGYAGAHLALIRNISVCATDLSKFKPEPLDYKYLKKGKVHIPGVPTISQMHDIYQESSGWCSPTSLAQVIEYYTQEKIDLPSFAHSVRDTGLDMYGSWPFNTAMAGVHLPDHTCYVTRFPSLKGLIKLLSQGYPVVVSICCSQPLPGAPKAYDKGHLITVVGVDFNKKEIICHDTAESNIADNIKHYPLKPFVQAWDRRHRLAYVIVPHKV